MARINAQEKALQEATNAVGKYITVRSDPRTTYTGTVRECQYLGHFKNKPVFKVCIECGTAKVLKEFNIFEIPDESHIFREPKDPSKEQ